jgi:hypothetical protein
VSLCASSTFPKVLSFCVPQFASVLFLVISFMARSVSQNCVTSIVRLEMNNEWGRNGQEAVLA